MPLYNCFSLEPGQKQLYYFSAVAIVYFLRIPRKGETQYPFDFAKILMLGRLSHSHCIGVKGGVPMNGILFAPGPGSAWGWAGRVPGPSRRPGPPGAGPARMSSLSVRSASLQKRSRSSIGPQNKLCFISFSGIWQKWKIRCVCDCIAPGIPTFCLPEIEK